MEYRNDHANKFISGLICIAAAASWLPLAAQASSSILINTQVSASQQCGYPSTMATGAAIQSENCSTLNESHRWEKEAIYYVPGSGGSDASFANRYRNVQSGLCLDLVSASTANGVQLVQKTCGTSTTQHWRVSLVGNSFLTKNVFSGKCIDKPTSGPLQQWDCNDSSPSNANQRWGMSGP